MKIGLAIAGSPLPFSTASRPVRVRHAQQSKLVGILFCSPVSGIGRDEIVPNLDYFNERSSRFIDLYCVGYECEETSQAKTAGETVAPGEKGTVVATVGGKPWRYSPKVFNVCRSEVEEATTWQFTGETDLILVVARRQPDGTGELDFSTAVSCNLEQMLRDKAFTSVRAFFETLCRFGEDYQGEDPVWGLSDRMGLAVGAHLLRELLLKLVPESVRKAYRSAQHYAIRDVSK